VEKGHIPISIAVTIASSDEEAVRQMLSEAYDKKGLRGKALLRARRIVEKILQERRRRREGDSAEDGANFAADKLMEAYEAELARQQALIRKATLCETRLTFVVSALKSLFKDDNFVNLLRVERLETLPHFLAERVGSVGA
jgi:ParB family chromosome partitioning protein